MRMRSLLAILFSFWCIAAPYAAEPASLVATADRIAESMMEQPPENLTSAEIALAFGWMHLFGLLGEPGPGRAVEYLEAARADGLPEAGVVLGALYLGQTGAPVERDVPKAIEYYKQAADDDCVDALRMLGIIYTEGEDGIEADAEQAFTYLRRAAELGSETALEYLQPHMDEAAAWERDNPGGTADFPSSREQLVNPELAAQASLRFNRISEVTARVFDLLAERMDAEDAASLSAAASKAMGQDGGDVWARLEQAVEDGVARVIASQPNETKQGEAALVVGIFHYMGLLNGYDPERAQHYLEIALEKGVPEAGVTLGELYLGMTRGDDAGEDGRDSEKGLTYLREAAEKDNVDALRVLGLVYADGRDGIEPDPAESYFRKAARHGDELALARLKANPNAGEIEIDPELEKAAAARREEIEAMVQLVNIELERTVMETMQEMQNQPGGGDNQE